MYLSLLTFLNNTNSGSVSLEFANTVPVLTLSLKGHLLLFLGLLSRKNKNIRRRKPFPDKVLALTLLEASTLETRLTSVYTLQNRVNGTYGIVPIIIPSIVFYESVLCFCVVLCYTLPTFHSSHNTIHSLSFTILHIW